MALNTRSTSTNTDEDLPARLVRNARASAERDHSPSGRQLRHMRLRYIADVDFRQSEWTNFQEVLKARPELAKLSADDVVLLRSNGGAQVVFVYAALELESAACTRDGKPRLVLRSERLRLVNGGAWNPLMIGDYAEQVGIRLEGIKTLREHYAHLVAQVQWKDEAKEAAKGKGKGKGK